MRIPLKRDDVGLSVTLVIFQGTGWYTSVTSVCTLQNTHGVHSVLYTVQVLKDLFFSF